MRAKGPFGRWMWMVHIWVALLAIAACTPYLEPTGPTIVVDPISGHAGTSVAVSGSGFPPKVRVSVRLGPPSVGATPHAYGETTTGADGKFTLSFTVPAFWPDGAPITETHLMVVVLNRDGSAKAAAPFAYMPPTSAEALPALNAQEARRQMVLAWHRQGDDGGFCGDLLVYEGGYVEILSCSPAMPLERRQLAQDAVEQLNAWTAVYRSFQVEQTFGTDPSRVRVRTTFVGHGSRLVSDVELRMIQALLEKLVVRRS